MQADTVAFANAEEAWFWAVLANEGGLPAAADAAPRPCEPGDVIRAVDRLYRKRQLVRDHLHVLVHYGRRQSPPDPERSREARAADLWREAMDQLGVALAEKGWAVSSLDDQAPTEPSLIEDTPPC